MSSIVIAEKPSQARDYEGAVGTRYGKILAARGHLFKLADPEDENPDWAVWTIGVMRPESGFFRTVLQGGDADIKRRYIAIRDAARSAKTIYVATDPDREGEGIGGNIVNQLRKDIGWEGQVLRVLPLGTDKKSLEDAFAQARPGSEFRNLFQSYQARSQSDQIFNLSLTRSASKAFLPQGKRGSLSVGRVLTPTFGMVCRRHLEIEAFVPRPYFLPWVEVTGSPGAVRLVHVPKEDQRIFDKELAARLSQAASDYAGPIKVIEERKKQAPPPLFSLSKLQVEASRRMKWGVQKTLDVLQSLYQDHKATTYPRSSEVSLPEAEIANIPAMKAGALALPFVGQMSWASDEPVVRRRKGSFSDKDLKGAAHYAIVPNVNTAAQWGAAYDKMNADERRLFEIIVRRYLAAIAPDRIYDSTRLSIAVEQRVFVASGTVEVSPGWREAMGQGQLNQSDEDGAVGDAEEQGVLPPFKDGDAVRATGFGVSDKMTAPPPDFTEATLGTAMIEAWKLVDAPEIRAKMKETDGIGTEATRAGIIENMAKRGFVNTSSNGKLAPTSEGLEFYNALLRYAPNLLDVGLTGEMEIALEAVKSGDVGARTAVENVAKLAQSAVESFLAGQAAGTVVTPPVTKGGKGKGARKGGAPRGSARSSSKAGKPTEGMQKAAKAKAQRDGMKSPPSGVLSDFDKCRAYLGPLPPKGDQGGGGAGPVAPSDKQLSFAKVLSKRTGVPIPDGTEADRRKLSDWIDLQTK